MNKRIILFGPLPPPHGGVAIYLKLLKAHFAGSEIRVWSYTRPDPGDTRVRFVAHRQLGTLWALLAEGRRARILDATHFHLEYPNPLLLPIWLLLKKLLRFEWYKNILDGSLPKRYQQFGKLQRRLFRSGINAVDEFVVVSDDLRRWLQDDMKVSQPITVIPCLLPPLKSEMTPALSSDLEQVLKPYLSRDRRVCSIGVFIPSYGFRDVASAVEELRKQTGKDIGLALLDGGFVCDESYRDEVLRGRDWITVAKKVPNSDVYQILKQSDVFVRAVSEEGFGISRVEALWSGTSVIATRVGETRGMLLYNFGDLEQLTQHLQSVLFDAPLPDENQWPELYRKEAQNNLAKLAEVLGIETGV